MGQGEIVARTYPAGSLTWVRDATTNDSDKTFTVPANKIWEIKSVEATIIASATVGNRLLQIQINNDSPAILVGGKITGNISASVAGGIYAAQCATEGTVARGRIDGGSYGNNAVQSVYNLPVGMRLTAGMSIRVWDTAAIDAAADDMTVVLHYEELDV